MRKRSTLLVSIFSSIAVALFGLVACKKENKSVEQSENLIESRLLMNRLVNLEEQKAIQSIVTTIRASGYYFKNVSNKLDLESGRVFYNKKEGKYVLSFNFTNDTTKIYSVYGTSFSNEYRMEGEVLIANELDGKGNYTKYVVKNQEAFKVNYQNGKRTLLEDLNYVPTDKWDIIFTTDCQGRHGGTGFCQREPGESFGSCHRAEVDEFTDDFLGWIYYKANELVVDAMIAAACSCSATQCR